MKQSLCCLTLLWLCGCAWSSGWSPEQAGSAAPWQPVRLEKSPHSLTSVNAAARQIEIAMPVQVDGWATVAWVPDALPQQGMATAASVYAFLKQKPGGTRTVVLLVDVDAEGGGNAQNAWVQTLAFWYEGVPAVVNPVASRFLLARRGFSPWPEAIPVPEAAVRQMPWIHGMSSDTQVLVVGLPRMGQAAQANVGQGLAALAVSGPISLVIVSDLSCSMRLGADQRAVDRQIMETIATLQRRAWNYLCSGGADAAGGTLKVFSSPRAVWCGSVAASKLGANAIAFDEYKIRWLSRPAGQLVSGQANNARPSSVFSDATATMTQIGQIGAVFYDHRRTSEGRPVIGGSSAQTAQMVKPQDPESPYASGPPLGIDRSVSGLTAPDPENKSTEATVLSAREQQYLLRVARDAADAAVVSATYQPQEPERALLRQKCPAFVTIGLSGKPVRLVGSFQLQSPLYLQIVRLATAAVVSGGLDAESVRRGQIRIILPTTPEPVGHWRKIEPRQQGVIVEYGQQRGIAFPFEADNISDGIDHDDVAKAMWTLACKRAGVSPDAVWRGAAMLSAFDLELLEEAPLR